jgi:hypothetical protein
MNAVFRLVEAKGEGWESQLGQFLFACYFTRCLGESDGVWNSCCDGR